MDNNNKNGDHIYEKYLIVFALVLFSGIIIFNAVNSPLIGGTNIIYVNNTISGETVEIEDYSASSQPDDSRAVTSQYDEIDSIDSLQPPMDDAGKTENDASSSTADRNVADKAVPNEKININTADVNTLTDVPGIGMVIAKRIVDYRELNGNFKSVDELINVKGIGNVSLNRMKEYLTV